MDAETLEALKASIEKWERNVAATRPRDWSLGVQSCPLCKKFRDINRDDICSGCPVKDRTGKNGCDGSPYDNALDANRDWELGRATIRKARLHARREVAFLKSLLPDGEGA